MKRRQNGHGDDWPPSTLPNIEFGTLGIEDADLVAHLRKEIPMIAEECGRLLPLHLLAGITVATDLSVGVSSLDWDMTPHEIPAKEDLEGVAGLAVVMPGGDKPKVHVLLKADHAAYALSADEAQYEMGLYVIMYHLAMCAAYGETEQSFPGLLVGPRDNHLRSAEDHFFFRMTSRSWHEYFARRSVASVSSAPLAFADAEFGSILSHHPDFVRVLKTLRSLHGSDAIYLRDFGRSCRSLMTRASSVFGHLDGRREDLTHENAPSMFTAMNGDLQDVMIDMWTAQRLLWEEMDGCDGDYSIFRPLHGAADRLMARKGLLIETVSPEAMAAAVRKSWMPFMPPDDPNRRPPEESSRS